MTPPWYNSFLDNFWKENGFSKTMIHAWRFGFNNADLNKTKQNKTQNKTYRKQVLYFRAIVIELSRVRGVYPMMEMVD